MERTTSESSKKKTHTHKQHEDISEWYTHVFSYEAENYVSSPRPQKQMHHSVSAGLRENPRKGSQVRGSRPKSEQFYQLSQRTKGKLRSGLVEGPGLGLLPTVQQW